MVKKIIYHTHFRRDEENTLCGRENRWVPTTDDRAQVTCRRCMKYLGIKPPRKGFLGGHSPSAQSASGE